MPSLPPEEVTKLMRFIAEKSKNVKSPIKMSELCKQFKEETGSLMDWETLGERIRTYRHKIHKMDEFDMATKVKMIFALSAPIDGDFLVEMKKKAEVEVDDQQRIIHYKQKDGGLELSAKYKQILMKQGEDRDKEMIQLLAEKSSTVDKPIADRAFLREFKKKTACAASVETLEHRYLRVKETIHQSTGIDKNTKIKMMFISNMKLSDETLEELRKDADVEVDEAGKITKYKSNDGNLEFKGSHEQYSMRKSFYSDRWHTIFENIKKVASENDDEGNANWQTGYVRKRIKVVRFLIERTKNAISPLSISKLAKDYKTEFKNQGHLTATIRLLQKDAIVELDEKQRIKKYKAKDGSLELEGDHTKCAKRRLEKARTTKSLIVNDSSESEDDENEEDSSETDESEEEEAPTSSTARKSDRLQKSRISSQNNRGKKRARISYSPSESSEDLEESMTLGNDPSINSETNNSDHGGDDFDYDSPANNHYEENLEHNVTDPISGRNIATPEATDDMEEKQNEESASSSAKIESMSLLELLDHLRSPIAKYTPTLIAKIDEKIKRMESEDQQVPYHLIIESLEMCIQILNTPDEMNSDEETISISDFFYRLGMAMCNIAHSSMDDFHVKMRKLATTGNEKVSMENIRYAMEKTLDKILN